MRRGGVVEGWEVGSEKWYRLNEAKGLVKLLDWRHLLLSRQFEKASFIYVGAWW
jgi:hypothetical protein